MDRKSDYNHMAVIFFAAAIFILISAASPVTAIITAWVAAFFLAYAVAMWGTSGIVFTIIIFAAGCALNIKVTVFLAAAFLPLVLASGIVIQKKLRMLYSVMITSGAALFGIAAAFGILWLFTGLGPIDYVIGKAGYYLQRINDSLVLLIYQFTRFSDMVSGAITQSAVFSTPVSQAIPLILDWLNDYLNTNLVNIVLTNALLTGLLIFLIPRASVKKKRDVVSVPPFSALKLPPRFWLAYLISYFSAFAGMSMEWPSFDIAAVTISGVYGVVFIIQGLSFMDYLFKRKHLQTAVRIVLHVVITLVIGNMLVWVGLFENMANLRKRMDSEGGTVA